MSYFPMFVDLEGKHVLAVGAGTIGSRRILTLLKFGAQVTAVDPDGRKLKEMEGWNGLSWIREPYEAYRTRLLEKAPDFFMVLTATGNRETDLLAVSDGRRMGAFVNAAADRSLSDLFPRDCLRRLRDGRSDHRGRRPPAGKTGLRRGESFSDGMGRKLERTGTDCR